MTETRPGHEQVLISRDDVWLAYDAAFHRAQEVNVYKAKEYRALAQRLKDAAEDAQKEGSVTENRTMTVKELQCELDHTPIVEIDPVIRLAIVTKIVDLGLVIPDPPTPTRYQCRVEAVTELLGEPYEESQRCTRWQYAASVYADSSVQVQTPVESESAPIIAALAAADARYAHATEGATDE